MSKIRKALTAGLMAGLSALAPALSDGVLSGGDVSVILGAVIAAAVAVYLVPNAKPAEQSRL